MLQNMLALASGTAVGFVLSLIGGGGSVLAVPLLVYVVGVKSPHIAIGTSAVAVALSALSGLVGHARAGNVRWPIALIFAASGMAGSAIGSTIGKQVDGQQLLLLFGMLMLVVAASMVRPPRKTSIANQSRATGTARQLAPRLIGFGFATGGLAGFFGIGGGFLIVPGLIAAASLPLLSAIGSSLVSVTAFGLTTAANYALSDLIDWRLVVMFVVGGIVGGQFGRRLAYRLADRKQALAQVFAGIVASVGMYVVIRGGFTLLGR